MTRIRAGASTLATEPLLPTMVTVIMSAAHLHFLHHFLVRLWSAPYERLVFVRCKFRHFAQERHDVPQQFIIVRYAPGRHARHFDPMLTSRPCSIAKPTSCTMRSRP